MTSHNTDPHVNDGPKSPSGATEVGLMSERESSSYDAGADYPPCIVSQYADREWWCWTHSQNAEDCHV